MSLFEGTVANATPTPTCACCGAEAGVACWGIDLCRGCHTAWWLDPRFDSAAIDKAIGAKPWGQGEATDRTGELERYEAEAKKRTAAWVAERTKRAA